MLIIATRTAFSLFKEGNERVWVRDFQMQKKSRHLGFSCCLGGQTHLSFMPSTCGNTLCSCCVCVRVCVWVCVPLHLRKPELWEDGPWWKQWAAAPRKLLHFKLKKKKKETKKTQFQRVLTTRSQISSHALSLPWTHDALALALPLLTQPHSRDLRQPL